MDAYNLPRWVWYLVHLYLRVGFEWIGRSLSFQTNNLIVIVPSLSMPESSIRWGCCWAVESLPSTERAPYQNFVCNHECWLWACLCTEIMQVAHAGGNVPCSVVCWIHPQIHCIWSSTLNRMWVVWAHKGLWIQAYPNWMVVPHQDPADKHLHSQTATYYTFVDRSYSYQYSWHPISAPFHPRYPWEAAL